ncbi:universal stress protein [Actinocatenispora sera]|uniref:Universal stress protein n=1 Tax=Actinocatenispora sera TaxID=390989 RepID=A0A810L1T6_9ACTN|nr:universal stress protein [Actinocatenispora sera]BCJ28612.1 universal stress protein [Actinocatenispora sera]
MTDPILVGLDGSPPSRRAVRWAAAEAALRGSPLRILTAFVSPIQLYSVIPRSQLPDLAVLQHDARDRLTEQADAVRAEFPDVSVHADLVEQEPAKALVEGSAEASLTVVGQRGRGALAGMLLGSVSDRVATYASGTVVVVPDEPAAGGPVVVGTDGSAASQRAVAVAFEEADRRRTELVAVRAWLASGLDGPNRVALVLDVDEMAEQERRLLEESLAEGRSKHPDVPVRPVLGYGSPVAQLGEQAEGARLLVVGSRGRGGFTGMLLGSTSRSLLYRARCPVAVVRP